MRRSWSRAILAAALITVTLLYPLLAPPAHRIDKAHFEMIRPGMTHKDVEAIFGVPPGEYDWAEAKEIVVTGDAWEIGSDGAPPRKMRFRQVTWLGTQGSFTITFDDQDRVDHKIGPLQIDIVPPWQRVWRAMTK